MQKRVERNAALLGGMLLGKSGDAAVLHMKLLQSHC
jgi:hypothetical protein